MARKATKRKAVKTKAKKAIKRTAKKATKKATKKVVRKATKKTARKVVAKTKKKVARRKSAAKRSVRKVASSYDTAMSTLTHYIEQGGKNLSDAGKATLEAARDVIHDVSSKIGKLTA